MPIRVIAAQTKITYFVAGVALVLTVGSAAGIALGGVAGIAINSILLVALFGVASRTFRGTGEPIVPPRAWWRLTAGPVAGFVIAGLFVVSGVGSAISGSGPDSSAVLTVSTVLSDGAVAAAYLNSSIRLLRSRM